MKGTFLTNERVRKLFEALSHCEKLIFATGVPDVVSANLVGRFNVRRRDSEDCLDMDDGVRHHVHIQWDEINWVVSDHYGNEGRLTFLDSDNTMLFKFYNPNGPFPQEVVDFAGDLRMPE